MSSEYDHYMRMVCACVYLPALWVQRGTTFRLSAASAFNARSESNNPNCKKKTTVTLSQAGPHGQPVKATTPYYSVFCMWVISACTVASVALTAPPIEQNENELCSMKK